MRITRVWAYSYSLIFMLGLALMSLPYLQDSHCNSYSGFNIFSITDPSNGQTQGSFASIQEAINEAENGTTIIIPAGIYYEHVIINKTITLVGEENFTSIIDGTYNGTVVEITADNVVIRNFKLQNSGYGWDRNGVYAHNADNFTIEGNFLHNVCHNIKIGFSNNSRILENVINGTMTAPTMYGIRIENSTNCIAVGNSVSDCVGGIHLQNTTNSILARNIIFNSSQGIRFYSPCTSNEVFENTISNNGYDGMISTMPQNITFANNTIFHNNFLNNTNPFIYTASGFIWDNSYPSGGNYWSRYNETDLFSGPHQNETGNDGVGDTQYKIGNSYEADRYPLIHPYGSIQNFDNSNVYLTIQSAINSPETLSGHTIFVKSGTYREHIILNKTITLTGENETTTFIDGESKDTVFTIKADYATVVGFTIQNSGQNYPPYGNDCGLLLDHCNGSSIIQNRMTNNRIGIYLYFSRSNILEQNIISSNNESGIWLWYSGNNALTGNVIFNNAHNFGVFGDGFSDFDNAVDTSNVVNGRPITYLIGVENLVLDGQQDPGTVYLVNCRNVTVRDMTLNENGHGVFCYNVTDSTMENITASNSSYGIYLQNSFNSNVSNCSCSGNWVGICLQGSYNSSVEDNIATDNEKGISLYEADNNTLTGNTLDNNYYGIRLFSSNRNLIFHNNLVKNTEQADLINSHQNHWNNEIEGNFWGEHNGTDAGDNGICADQYVIDAENSDTYPLMGRFQNFVVYYDEQLLRVSVISNSTIYDFAYSNSTITFIVNGPYQNLGFCRICIPHDLVGPEIGVIIDGGTTEMLHVNYTVYDDGLHRWVYFTYRHSEHEILIVPESFQSLMLCLLVFTASAYIAKLKKPLVIANIKATLNIFQNMHRDTHSRKV